MDTMTIVWIVLAVVLLLALFKVLKNVISFAISTVGIVVVVWLMILGLKYVDESNLRDNLLASNNLFLLQDSENNLLTGFASNGDNLHYYLL